MSTAFLDKFVDPLAEFMTVEAARKIAAPRADDELQAEVDRLADSATRGTLTPEDRRKYQSILAANHFMSMLQARARRIVRQSQVK